MYGSASFAVWKLATTGALLLTLLLGVAACGDSDSSDSADEPSTSVEVELSHTFFTPSELTVAAGDTVIFRNIESMSHPLVNEELGLDTGEFTKGERSFAFDKPGSFTITNTAHGTTITVVVQPDGS